MKIKSLEGLRGAAAYSVVIFHFFSMFLPALVNGTPDQVLLPHSLDLFVATTPLNFFYNGNFAVCIFFVLSGFVLTNKFFTTKDSEVIVSGAIRRYVRLMIPVLFSVLCFYAAYQIKSPYNVFNISNFSFISAIKEGLYGTFINVSNQYNPVLWTMHFEFFGSFMVFGFCLFFGKLKNRWIIYALLALFTWNTSYFAFVLGMGLSDISANRKIVVRGWLQIILLLLAIFLGSYPNKIGIVPGAITVDQTMYGFLQNPQIPYVFIQTIGAALLLFLVLVSKRMDSCFSKPLFQFLGKISFPLYLTHPIFAGFFSIWFLNEVTPKSWAEPVRFLVTFIIANVLIIAFAYVVERLVDSNAIKLSKKIEVALFRRPAKSLPKENREAPAV